REGREAGPDSGPSTAQRSANRNSQATFHAALTYDQGAVVVSRVGSNEIRFLISRAATAPYSGDPN
ncbi:hypothetical protein HaLaN_18244, partial [Haematococcus lacustris]